jgi:D-glycero-alpha-D-manno-heptose-7-phosphate kinase
MSIIISKTPYRISLFGGGTDYKEWYKYNGSNIISASINKYIYVSYLELKNFFPYKYRIIYSKTEEINNINQIKLNVIREAFRLLKIKNGIELHYNGDLPARSGMGSSSAFVVGIMKILKNINGKFYKNCQNLADDAINFEQNILKEIVGIQDQIATSFCGLNCIEINKKGNYKVASIYKNKKDIEEFEQKLFLVFTNQKREEEFKINYTKNLNKMKQLHSIQQSSSIALKILKEKDFLQIGNLLHETWIKKKEISNIISNQKIDNFYSYCLDSGARGGKLLGAGGGGFLLFYVDENKKKQFLKKLEKYIVIPIKIIDEGKKLLNVCKI